MKKFLIGLIIFILIAVSGFYYYLKTPSNNAQVINDVVKKIQQQNKVKQKLAFKKKTEVTIIKQPDQSGQEIVLPELSEDCQNQLEKRRSALQLEVSEDVFKPLSSSCTDSLINIFGLTPEESDQIMSTCNGAKIIKRTEKLLAMIPGNKNKIDTSVFKDKKCQYALINHFSEFVDYYVSHREEINDFGNKLYLVIYEDMTEKLQAKSQDDSVSEIQKVLFKKVLDEASPFIYEVTHTLMRTLLINAFDEGRINRDKEFVTVLENYKEYEDFQIKYEALIKSEKYQELKNTNL